MSQHAAIPPQWPAHVVQVTYTPLGVRLHFPVLRGWRVALKLALFGLALFVPALFASIAFAPSGQPEAAAMLVLVLTAVVVYPVVLFGALFVLVALYAVANSLTVEVDANAIRAVRRVFGVRLGAQTLRVAAIVELKPETAVAPGGLGGKTFYRLAALTAELAAGNRRAGRMIVADGVPDEPLIEALKALIARYAQLDRVAR